MSPVLAACLLALALGIGRPSAMKGNSSGERNNSCRAKCESKSKPNANCTLLRYLCRFQVAGSLGHAANRKWLVSYFRAQHLPCISWKKKGAGRGTLALFLPRGGRPSEMGDWHVPWSLFLSWMKTSGCKRKMTAKNITAQDITAPVFKLQGVKLEQGPAPSYCQTQDKLTK